jgi:Fe-S cluster biogenesis protein NfuA
MRALRPTTTESIVKGAAIPIGDTRFYQIPRRSRAGYTRKEGGRHHMISRERVQAVIERIRPLIQGDGGDIELVEVLDNKAKVRLTGNCVGCPSAQMTLFMGVEMALKEEIPDFEELLVV